MRFVRRWSPCAWLLVFAAASCSSPEQPSSPASPSSAVTTSTSVGCARTSVGFTPVSDLGTRTYNGQAGGLYPNGSNTRPASHESAGLARARAIVPLDRDGQPDSNGQYVLVSTGMSNTTQKFSVFKTLADADPTRDRHLTIVDGAQGGRLRRHGRRPGAPAGRRWETGSPARA